MDTQTLIQYIHGGLSEKERNQVAEWIGESKENRKEYQALRRLYDLSVWNLPETKAYARKARRKQSFLWIAAALFFLILGGLALRSLPTGHGSIPLSMSTITVPSGRELSLDLADNSKVWLNAGSRLSFDPKARDRRVYLEGEAYFIIAPDPKNPFVVETFDHSIQVLGTEFNVSARENLRQWEVALVEGSVRILDKRGEEVTTLSPGKRITLNGNSLTVSRIDANKLLWKEGILSFDNFTLNEILQRLSDFYGVHFDTSGLTTGDKRYTGKFRSQVGYEHILKSLQMIHADFSYRIPDDESGEPVRIY